MRIQTAEFICSNTDPQKCPQPKLPEYAFVGRSNVGKSSLINALTGRKNLAKISGKPGKTQLINHFLIDKRWYLVDLPGYGWAQVSKTRRESFAKIHESYFLQRQNLCCIFVLIDLRHEPQKNDLAFLRQIGEWALPFALVFTKSDKLSQPKQQKSLAHFQKVFLKDWEKMPPHFITSAVRKSGCAPLLDFIQGLNMQFD